MINENNPKACHICRRGTKDDRQLLKVTQHVYNGLELPKDKNLSSQEIKKLLQDGKEVNECAKCQMMAFDIQSKVKQMIGIKIKDNVLS